ncbi:MAG: hypothetical protein ACFE8P_12545, partial [Promethearchaeota archaeon]
MTNEDKGNFLDQMECVICGSHDNLIAYKYVKREAYYKDFMGKTWQTYKKKSTDIPMCSTCKKKTTKRKIILGITIILFIVWILVFFPLFFYLDFNSIDLENFLSSLFISYAPLNMLGLLSFVIIILILYAHTYNPRTSVKFGYGKHNKSIYIFSRRIGNWISHDQWKEDVITDRTDHMIKKTTQYPQKKSSISKFQFIGSFLILFSVFAPFRISFFDNSVNLTWSVGINFFFSLDQSLLSITTVYHELIDPISILYIGSSQFIMILIIILGFYAIRNSTYLKKTQKLTEHIERNYQIV